MGHRVLQPDLRQLRRNHRARLWRNRSPQSGARAGSQEILLGRRDCVHPASARDPAGAAADYRSFALGHPQHARAQDALFAAADLHTDEIAGLLGTINYEVVFTNATRVPRKYLS